MQHWLCWKAGISSWHAGEVVRLATARESHPLIMETFGEGLLSVDQVAIATKAPVHLDDWFATVAQSATVAQLRTIVRARLLTEVRAALGSDYDIVVNEEWWGEQPNV